MKKHLLMIAVTAILTACGADPSKTSAVVTVPMDTVRSIAARPIDAKSPPVPSNAVPVGLTGSTDLWPRIIGVPENTTSGAYPDKSVYESWMKGEIEVVPWAHIAVQRRAPTTFVLDSGGGSAVSAVVSARLMAWGDHTAVLREGAVCDSACSMTALAAKTLIVERGSGFWMHGLTVLKGDDGRYRQAWIDYIKRKMMVLASHRDLKALDSLLDRWSKLADGESFKLTEQEMRALGIQISDRPGKWAEAS